MALMSMSAFSFKALLELRTKAHDSLSGIVAQSQIRSAAMEVMAARETLDR